MRKVDLEEVGYESETLREGSGQGDTSISKDSNTNNEEETNGEEEPRRRSTKVKRQEWLEGG